MFPASSFPISFVILTDGRADGRILQTIGSIYSQSIPIPAFQIIIVGGETTTIERGVTHVPFDENQTAKPWITRKKNLAAPLVEHDVTVWMHDYHVFDRYWYQAMIKYGLGWDIQMNAVQMDNGYRMFDWVNLTYPNLPSHFAIPYDRTDLVQHQYIPGGYWVSKRHVMLEEPQNENLLHFDCEDVEWSRRVLPKYKYVMNKNARVHHSKTHRECAFVAQREAEHARFTGWE